MSLNKREASGKNQTERNWRSRAGSAWLNSGGQRGATSAETNDHHLQLTTTLRDQRSKASPPDSEEEERPHRKATSGGYLLIFCWAQAMKKHYNLRDRERDNSEMNGDGAGNLQALGVADSGTGGHGSGTSDTASEQQLALLQLQLKFAEAEMEKQRLMLESQRLRARNGAESNESDDSVALGGRPWSALNILFKKEDNEVGARVESWCLGCAEKNVCRTLDAFVASLSH
ncbi:hypothetical protein HPB51_027011 [Rhipicephalus microplus]|uniref:Uncharacterized protein n=1 Tax=Rhipicephalus microplus TaxID=6941 RepID=A0A9J6D1Q3_RHIMP|nr:hypothetical protein HPB51_027011 [Rhipicephalus microplus]